MFQVHLLSTMSDIEGETNMIIEGVPEVPPSKPCSMLKFVGVQGVCVAIMAGHFFLISLIYHRSGMLAGDMLAILMGLFIFACLYALLVVSSQFIAPHWDGSGSQREVTATMSLFLFLVAFVILAPIHGRSATNLQSIQSIGEQVPYPTTPQEISNGLGKGFTSFAIQPEWIQRQSYGFSPSHLLMAIRDTNVALFGQTGPNVISPLSRLPVQDDGRIWVSQIDDLDEYFYTLEDFRKRNPSSNVSWSVQILSPNSIRTDWKDASAYHERVMVAIYSLLGITLSIAAIVNVDLYSHMK